MAFDTYYTLNAYLRTLQYKQELPAIIVLYSNMLTVSGYETLRLLKSQVQYQSIAVFLFTTSPRDKLVEQRFREGAAGYYKKPNSLHELRAFINELCNIALKCE